MNDSLLKQFSDIELLKTNKKIAVAVSGGIDSLSLILLANEWAKQENIEIIGLTVNHQLRDSSENEALYLNNLLINKYNIKHFILNWDGEKPKTNIENTAREARYNLIFNFCKQENIDTILLGHHIQDQAENFLIRLFRGSGINGLSSMEIVSHRNGFNIIRPFLNIKKEDLQEYLLNNDIKWIEDESNTNEKYLRNKIRNFLNSFEEKENIINHINSTVNFFQLAEEIIEKEIEKSKNIIYYFNEEYNYYTIKINEFLNLNLELKYRILLKVINTISTNNKNTRIEKIERLIQNIENSIKCTFYGCIFAKINNNEFVCYKEYNSIKDKTNYLKKGELNKYLIYLKNTNFKEYKKIKDFRGFKREILYTIPIKK